MIDSVEGENYYTIKYNSEGDRLWEKSFDRGNNDDDFAYGVTVDSVNKIIISGASTGLDDLDYVTIKYGEKPISDFIYNPLHPTDLDDIQFINTSMDPAGEIVSWQWDFG